MIVLGAICGSAISMDLLAQSMDPYSAQKSMDCADISRVNKHLRLDKIAIEGFSPEISSFVPLMSTVENPHKSLHGKCPIFTKIQYGGQPI